MIVGGGYRPEAALDHSRQEQTFGYAMCMLAAFFRTDINENASLAPLISFDF